MSREHAAELGILIGIVGIMASCIVSVAVQYWEIRVNNPGLDPFAGLKAAFAAVYRIVANLPKIVWVVVVVLVGGLFAFTVFCSRRKPDEIVGRDEELATLARLIKRRHDKRVLVISGPSGVGKSLLLDVFAQVCSRRGFRWAKIDFRDGSLGNVDILYRIAEQLRRGDEFSHFLSQYTDYVSIMAQEGESTHGDQAALKELEAQLLRTFLGGVKHLAKPGFWSNRSVMFFDTIEQASGTELGTWLLNTFVSALISADKHKSGVLIILSGRGSVKLGDDVEQWTLRRELQAFSPTMVREYLTKTLGHTDDTTTSGVFELTDGHPLNVGILVDLLKLLPGQEAFGEALDGISARIGMGTAKERVTYVLVDELNREMIDVGAIELAALVRKCATPRWFDVSHISSLDAERSSDESHVELEKLREFSFIKPRSLGGYAYHEIVRDAILSRWETDSSEELRTLHLHWSEFYKAKEASLVQQESRRRNRLEILYHLLRYEESTGVELFAREIEDLDSFREISYFSALAEELRSVDLRPANQLWLDYYDSYQILYSGDWIRASHKFREILAHPETPSELKALVAYELGKVLAIQGDNPGAEELYLQALDIQSKRQDWEHVARILLRLGQVYRWVSKWEEAVLCFGEGLQHAERINDRFVAGWILTNLGVSYKLQGNLEKARVTYEQSLEIQREINNLDGVGRSLRYLGGAYLTLGRLDDAERAFQECIDVLEHSAQRYTLVMAQIDLATTNILRKRFENVQQCLEGAESLIQEMEANPLIPSLQSARSRCLRAAGKPDEALRLLEQCQEFITQENLFGNAIYKKELADTLAELGRYAEARSYYKECISEFEKLKSCYELSVAQISLCELQYKELGLDIGEGYHRLLDETKALITEYNYHDIAARVHKLEGHIYLCSGAMNAAMESYSLAYAEAVKFDGIAEEVLNDIMFELRQHIVSA